MAESEKLDLDFPEETFSSVLAPWYEIIFFAFTQSTKFHCSQHRFRGQPANPHPAKYLTESSQVNKNF